MNVMDKQDLDLGMGIDITRRDFLDGVAIGVISAAAASAAASPADAATAPAAGSSAIYPPIITGLRGQNEEAVNAGHAVRDGKAFDAGRDTGEVYALVVVGAGMAGLSAAYFYRKQLPNAKVLVIDGCDDFGGHARRNEFNVDGHQLLAPGGTMSITGFDSYMEQGKTLLRDIGVDPDRYVQLQAAERNPFREQGLRPAMFFPREKYGIDRLATGLPSPADRVTAAIERSTAQQSWGEYLAKTPFSEGAKAGLLKYYTDTTDYMPGLSQEEKVRQLRKMTYIDYLLKVAEIHPDAVAYVQNVGGHYANNHAAGPDTFSAWYAYRHGQPGFAGLGLPQTGSAQTDFLKNPGPSITFPDGNAGVARLLVRWLVPDSLPGSTMEDSVAPHVKYETLDRPGNDVRIRLSSTCVRVRHLGDPITAKEVEVTYVRDKETYRVRAGAVVMACFNAIIPYLVPELPEVQKAALHMAVRKPLIQVNVGLRNWRAFQKLGVSSVTCPHMFYGGILLFPKVGMGSYRNPTNPDEPISILLTGAGEFVERHGSGLPPREQWKAARAELMNIPFETYERHVRDLLQRVLGPGGFIAKRDITGIIVNRWGHAYATGANELYDPDWAHRADAPWVVGRQRFGRITISNSDAAATSMTQAAMQQSHRAVNEIINDIVRPVFTSSWSERDTAGEPGDAPNNF